MLYYFQRKNFSSFRNSIVRLTMDELTSRKIDLTEKMDKAFGKNGLGIITVKLKNFDKIKENHILNFIDFFKLPEEEKKKCITKSKDPVGWVPNPGSSYSKLDQEYTNQYFLSRYPNESVGSSDRAIEEINKNLWPEKIPNFKTDFNVLMKTCTRPIVETLYWLEQYLRKLNPGVNYDMYDKMKDNHNSSGTTLIYLPKNTVSEADWNSWHSDSGLLTILNYPFYYDRQFKRINDNLTGIQIKDRKGRVHDVEFD